MNIVFMGTPDFSVPALRILIENGHTVQAVLTQPDRPRGRGKKLQPTPVKVSAEAAGIPVYTPQSLRKGEDAAEMLELLKKLNPELIVVIAYGQILPKPILDLPKYGCINLHASLLPRWRGAAPIQRAILAGDAETGVTAMQMAEGLDTGDMLHTLKTRISETETAETLHDRLSLLSAETLAETIEEVTARLRSSAPSFAGGDGEIEIVLKAHVLDGSTVHMSVRGGVVSVCFTPATPDAASFIEKNISRLKTSLSERIPRFRFSVSARKEKKK
jgi:methionyl-tRNA formyltransferase